MKFKNIKTKKSIKLFFILLITLIITQSILVLAQDNSNEKESILSKLNTYYEAGKSEDVDKYLSVQDRTFLSIVGGKDYQAYIEAAFKETDTVSYEIISPNVIIMNQNQAFIFYELKAKIKITSTGEITDIDNNMVAALWKYDNGGWKIRYTMLKTVFDEKMQIDIFSEAAFDQMINRIDTNTSLKKEFVKEGLINPKDESLYNKQSKLQSFLGDKIIIGLIAFALIIVALIFGFKLIKKKKSKKHEHKEEKDND